MLSKNTNRQQNKHVDDSEVFKMKTLSSAKKRKQMGKIMTWIGIAAAIVVLAFCVFAYCFDK